MDRFSYTWMVNIDKYQEEKKFYLFSRKFSVGNTMKWRLHLKADSSDKENEDYLSVFLVLAETNEKEVWAKFQFSILNDKREKVFLLESRKACRFIAEKACGFKRFLNKDFLFNKANGLLRIDGKFSIVCEVSILDNAVGHLNLSNALQQNREESDSRLPEDLWLMFENQEFSDITLAVGDKEFKAHKSILAARSLVFAAMLTHKMEESEQNRINITDFDSSVIREMLRFIYTGKSPNLESMPEELLAAADKYQLEKLKQLCIEALCKSLTVENAIKILILADLYRVDKAQVFDYIAAHAEDVTGTEEFTAMLLSHPNLAAEAYRALAAKIPQQVEQQDAVDEHIRNISNATATSESFASSDEESDSDSDVDDDDVMFAF